MKLSPRQIHPKLTVTRSEIHGQIEKSKEVIKYSKHRDGFESRLGSYEGHNVSEIGAAITSQKNKERLKMAGKVLLGLGIGVVGGLVTALVPGIGGVIGGGLIKFAGTYVSVKGIFDGCQRNAERKQDQAQLDNLAQDGIRQRKTDDAFREYYFADYGLNSSPALSLSRM